MNLTITLPDADAEALRAKATASGLSAEQYALQVIIRDLALEWLSHAWANTPVEGFEHWTMDDIDAEIAAARRDRRARNQTSSQ